MTAWLCGCTWERLIKYSQVSGLLKKSVFPFFFPKKGKTNCHLPGFFRAARAHTQEQLGGAVMQRGGSPWCPVRRGGAGPRRCREPRSSRPPRAPRARASASPQAAPPTTRQVSSEHRRGACRFGGTVTPACPWRGERRMGAGPRGHAPLDWPAGGSRDRGGRSGGRGGGVSGGELQGDAEDCPLFQHC